MGFDVLKSVIRVNVTGKTVSRKNFLMAFNGFLPTLSIVQVSAFLGCQSKLGSSVRHRGLGSTVMCLPNIDTSVRHDFPSEDVKI
jgi:hypothetical protein